MTPLEKARRAYQEKLKAGLIERLDPLKRAHKHPKSLRLAINAKCWDCNAGENWINRTRYCNIFDCPLWHVRKGAADVSKEACSAWEDKTGR